MKNFIKNLVLFFIVLTCFYLGLWQLDRADEKLKIQNDFKSQLSKPYVNLGQLDKSPKRYTKVESFGSFFEPYFLLDNVVLNKKAGYLVFSPFLFGENVVLVNRGWVDNYSRQKFPKITTPKEKINISGYIKYPMKLLELSNSNITSNEPYILQNLDINKISNILNKDVYPFYINLESGSDYGFQHLVVKNENKHLTHYMYAGQWFLFTLVGIIFLIILNRSRGKKNE